MRFVFGLLFLPCMLATSACADDDAALDSTRPDSATPDASMAVGDGDGDRDEDSGAEPNGAEPPIAFRKITLHREFYCEGAAIADLDDDGHADVIAGPHWYAGPDFEEQHALWQVTAPADIYGYSNCFFQWARDLDDDGALDVLVVGFPGEPATWLQNPGVTADARDGEWASHPIAATIDDESPELLDVVGDDAPELLFASGGKLVYATPASDPFADWTLHAISDDRGFRPFSHGLGAFDVNGDGRSDVVEASAWWEQPASLTGDPIWTRHEQTFGSGGGQMLGDDIDDDGDLDLVTTLSAHSYGLAWFENRLPDAFETHVIVSGAMPEPNTTTPIIHEPHALAMADLDEDGLRDLIVGERHWGHVPEGDPDFADPARLYWFRLVHGAEGPRYQPYLIDDDSGIGTQITLGDVNGDDHVDIVIANKKGAFIFVQERE